MFFWLSLEKSTWLTVVVLFLHIVRCSNVFVNETGGSQEIIYRLLKDFNSLEQRIKSLEQPSWEVTRTAKRWLSCSKGPCRCSLETKTVSCWRKGFDSIPRNQIVPYDTCVLDMSINTISALNKDIFKELQRIIELDLSNNRLDYLPEAIFQSLGSLQHLKLRNNMIEHLHKNVFRKQGRLENLDLSFNRLKSLDGDLLRWTPKLVAINLASNDLTVLPDGLLKELDQLEELDMSSNRLRTAPGMAGLHRLQAIDLASNCLTSLPSDLLKDTVRLESFSASRNELSYIEPNTFRHLPRLAFLDLTSNSILEISEDEYPPTLRELHLGQNKIKVLPPLRNLPHLERLYLFSNQISSLKGDVFSGTPSLKTLFLNDNVLSLIEPEVFFPLTSLENLQLGGNRLSHLAPAVFSHNTNLSAVKLTKNPWHCDCTLADFGQWLKDNKDKIWDMEPTCLGPGELGGRAIDEINREELCESTDDLPLAVLALYQRSAFFSS